MLRFEDQLLSSISLKFFAMMLKVEVNNPNLNI